MAPANPSKKVVESPYPFRTLLLRILDRNSVVMPRKEASAYCGRRCTICTYFLLDNAWRFKWNDLRGSLAVNNVLNTRYRDYLNDMRYFADDMGRNILIKLTYQISSKQRHQHLHD